MRHSFATHLLQHGHDIRTVQELPRHADEATPMTYLHVLDRGGLGVRSPLDRLQGRERAVGPSHPRPATAFAVAAGLGSAPHPRNLADQADTSDRLAATGRGQHPGQRRVRSGSEASVPLEVRDHPAVQGIEISGDAL